MTYPRRNEEEANNPWKKEVKTDTPGTKGRVRMSERWDLRLEQLNMSKVLTQLIMDWFSLTNRVAESSRNSSSYILPKRKMIIKLIKNYNICGNTKNMIACPLNAACFQSITGPPQTLCFLWQCLLLAFFSLIIQTILNLLFWSLMALRELNYN